MRQTPSTSRSSHACVSEAMYDIRFHEYIENPVHPMASLRLLFREGGFTYMILHGA